MTGLVRIVGRDTAAADALARPLAARLQRFGLLSTVCAGMSGANEWLNELGPGPDGVVLDAAGADGEAMAVCRELRRIAPRVAVVALVDPDRPESVIALLESGADDCVTVPFHPDEVVARLRAHLRRRAQHDTGMVGTPARCQDR